jgi:hypothetical protein
MAKKVFKLNKNLVTPFESDTTTSWAEYPRPSLKRDSYLCLNGEWDLFVTGSRGLGEQRYIGKINVPFTPETRLSGINREKADGEIYYYEKEIELAPDFMRGRIILHFGAVDQMCDVYVNGKLVTSHIGGYLPFSADITEYIVDGKNKLGVTVIDELDIELSCGAGSFGEFLFSCRPRAVDSR